MSNIIWKRTSELVDLKELLAFRQVFKLYGKVEFVNKDGGSVKVKICDKEKEWHGLWFSITDNFDVEPFGSLVDSDTIIQFDAYIETFFGKDNLLITKVTLSNWAYPEDDPCNLLYIENVTLTSSLATDQKDLNLLTFERAVEDKTERYHIRAYRQPNIKPLSSKATVFFNLRLSSSQINTEGVRMTGIDNYSYERDGETISGQRKLFKLCLEVHSIAWDKDGQ